MLKISKKETKENNEKLKYKGVDKVKFEGIVKEIIERAKTNKKTIVLPESNDKRVLEAAYICSSENIANIILIGNEKEVKEKYSEMGINILDLDINIVDPKTSEKTSVYAESLYELRKNKGVDLEKAKSIVQDYVYFATMMVKLEEADGMVSGAIHSTADTLRPALQIIKQAENINTVSAFFLMQTHNKELGSDGVFIFGDCGLVEFPTEEQLVDISIASAKSFKNLVKKEPKLALLSYSTKGSAKSDAITKTQNVVNKLNELDIDFEVDGELQLDAAIIQEVASLKAPGSKVAGNANVLIFPDLQSGNIGYKMAQRFGNMIALGPITQGLKKPINDLSRGCNVGEIVGAIAITSVQANTPNS